MKLAVTDWGSLDQVLPIASKYQAGLEVQEFASPGNLDRPDFLAKTIHEKTKVLPFLSMHGPFSDLIPASRDQLVKQAARSRFQQGFELARMIGAQHLILHSGFIPKTYPPVQWIQNSFIFWSDFLADKPYPGMIHLENVYEDEFTALVELIDRLKHSFQDERMTVCLDIGHVNANSSKTLEEWIIGLGDRIRYVHLHNNNGTLDDHWRLDKGKINIIKVLHLLQKYSPNAVWTIETFVEDIEPSLLWLQERGFM
jgi:sugar phosphate isomerase/epimerase